jgi:hypothetical protein
LLAGAVSAVGSIALAGSTEGAVEIIPIKGTIDEGMAHLVIRSIAEAQAQHARAIVLDVNTFGGLVTAGAEIRDALLTSPIPVDAYVARGTSAGALVTLAASRIVLNDAGTIGDAQPIPNDKKHVSFVRGEFEATARRYHRDPHLAAAMVDSSVDAPDYKPPGSVLNMTADDALKAHFSEATVASFDAALQHFGVANAARVGAEYTLAEQIARIATNPEISGILLAIGFLGLLIELQTLHGIAGAVGADRAARLARSRDRRRLGCLDPVRVRVARFRRAVLRRGAAGAGHRDHPERGRVRAAATRPAGERVRETADLRRHPRTRLRRQPGSPASARCERRRALVPAAGRRRRVRRRS